MVSSWEQPVIVEKGESYVRHRRTDTRDVEAGVAAVAGCPVHRRCAALMTTPLPPPRERADSPNQGRIEGDEPIPSEAEAFEADPSESLPPVRPLRDPLVTGLRRLTQWAHSRSWRHWVTRRLTPTQLKLLDLLAERWYGLSPTQVARELGISAATVSDCVGALKKKGFVTQMRNEKDRRHLTLRLTPEGQEIAQEALTSDPLLEVFADLSAGEQLLLHTLSLKMIHGLETREALPPQRTCVRCQFFRPYVGADSHTPHLCLQVQQPLSEREVRVDCPLFAPTDRQTQASVWEAFGNGVARRIAVDPGP